MKIEVCVGTSCMKQNSPDLLEELIDYVTDEKINAEVKINKKVNLDAVFCLENCHNAPSVKVGKKLISKATFETVIEEIETQALNKVK